MKNRRSAWGVYAWAFLALIWMTCGEMLRAEDLPSRPPNFIVLLTDDQAFSAIGYNNPQIKTPNLDRLAGQGLIFDRAYVATPICAASRAALLSGVFPQQNGVIALNGGAFKTWLRQDNHRSLPQMLNASGYRTALFGKSHLGSPQDMGFDRGKTYYDFSDIRTFKDAETFLEQMTEQDQSFMLWLGLLQPHFPLSPPAEWLELYDEATFDLPGNFRIKPEALSINNQGLPGEHFYREWKHLNQKTGVRAGPPRTEEQLRRFMKYYYAAISHMDDQVGQLLVRLDELGIRENTVIIFLSDNGFHLGSHGLGNKITMHEESVRVPMFIAGPPVKRRGATSSSLVSSLDIYPTLLELAGIDAPDFLTGRSLVPLFQDEPVDDFRLFVASECVGVGGKPGEGHRMVRTKDWKYVLTGTNEEFLFNESDDRLEMTNLADDSAHRSRLEQMRGHMRIWMEQVSDTHKPPPS